MFKICSACAVVLLAAGPALAQDVAQQQTPRADSSAPAEAPAGVVATTNNPNLTVATVKLENGERASKLIGSNVYNEQNEPIGSVDDLILTHDDKVTMAVVSVGGFLGLGNKLVAVPWSQLRVEKDKVIMPGASKDTLNAMPTLTLNR